MTTHVILRTASDLTSWLAPLPQEEQSIEGALLLLLILVIGVCFVALMVLLNLLLPTVSERGKTALLNHPWPAFFIGLANYLFLGGISLLLFALEIPPLGVLGLLITSFLLGITLLGLPGLVKLVGERLAEACQVPVSPLWQLIWGTVTLTLAGLLPFIGWFLLTPTLLMVSFGAAVLGWLTHWQRRSTDSSS